MQLGDAGTHFFHANATIRHRGNLINELTTAENVTVSSHKDKEQILWDEFRQRLGVSEYNGFTTPPSEIINASTHLQHLEEPFSVEEIDKIVKALTNNKSPGSDGFNNDFTKSSLANH